jgi:hypothetical protein
MYIFVVFAQFARSFGSSFALQFETKSRKVRNADVQQKIEKHVIYERNGESISRNFTE